MAIITQSENIKSSHAGHGWFYVLLLRGEKIILYDM